MASSSRRAYVIVTGGREARPGRYDRGLRSATPAGGRHRPGVPGTAARYPAGPPRFPGPRRPRHRRPADRRSGFAVRYASLVVLLGAVAVSGWFTAAGAAAFAQMVHP